MSHRLYAKVFSVNKKGKITLRHCKPHAQRLLYDRK